MTLNRKKIFVIALLMLIAWLCRFPPFHISTIPYIGVVCGLLRPLIYIGICTAWCVSLSRRIINNRLRAYMKSMAYCCILWLFFRTVKYELTVRGDAINIFLQYAYYIPFILLPTFGFFASMYARRGDQYSMPRSLYLIVSIISNAAILFVFTNPLHELYWTHTPVPYSHAGGYYVVVAWIVLLVVLSFMNIFLRGMIGQHTTSKLPLSVFGVIFIYSIMMVFFPRVWKYVSNDWTSFTCLSAVALMEACISSGMLPSNSGYVEAFEAASDEAIITDDAWNVCYASAGATIPPKEILQKTENGVYKADRNTLLKGSKLHPGHVVWKEDISAISAVLEELEQNRQELMAKNELDRENNRMELALSKVQEKNRLFDLAQAATAKQNHLLEKTLSDYFAETDGEKRKALLVKAAVLGAYIKRKGNLIFAEDGGFIRGTELKLCFKESLGNVELLNMDVHAQVLLKDETKLSLENALCLYDTFETAIEAALPDIKAAFIRVLEEDKSFKAVYSLVTEQDLSAVDFTDGVNVEKDEDTWIVSLALPKGDRL